jgi:hypothetical protein
MSASEAQRLKELEKENGRLKHLLADRVLENDLLKELLGKGLSVTVQREAVHFLVDGGRVTGPDLTPAVVPRATQQTHHHPQPASSVYELLNRRT